MRSSDWSSDVCSSDLDPLDIPVTATSWAPCYRIIPSRFPPVGLFDKVADPADLEAVFQIEAMTNDRLRDEAGALSLVRSEERRVGKACVSKCRSRWSPHH